MLSEIYDPEEEEAIYDRQLVDIQKNIKWYLSNLENLPTYRVSWKNYRRNTATLPKRHVKSKDL